MSIIIFLNFLIFLIVFIFISRRYRKFKQLQLLDILLFFYILFFPIGLIRPVLGYNTIIEYDMFNHLVLLEDSSYIVLIFLLAFILGCSIEKSFFHQNFNYKIKGIEYNSPKYLKAFRVITFINTILTASLLIVFLKSQGSISTYFANIDSIRQTLSGQMGNYTIIYLNVLLSLYTVLLHRKFVNVSKLGITISIIFFMVYGFRGFVLSILLVTFFVLQKLKIFQLKINLKNTLLVFCGIYLFVFFQDIREANIQKEPFLLKLITRFSGYESVMVVYDKVIDKGMFTFDTLYTNIVSFIQLPIPRTMFEEKIKPVSILFTEKLFYDIGYRSFDTGGISPTIVGSLIWNFHYLGIFFMFLFGIFGSYIERNLRNSKSNFKVLVYISVSLYLIMAIEYPENFAGVLWMLFIGLFVIHLLKKMLINVLR